jgi:hypothetical protein
MINPRNAINFFKTPAGAFLLFCVVLGVIFFACKRFLPGATKPQPLIYSTKAAAAAASKQTMQTFQNTNYSPLPNLPPSPTAAIMGDAGSQPEIRKAVQSCSGQTGSVAHQPVCRDAAIGTKAVGQKLRALWPVDSVRTDCHGGFIKHPNAHHRFGDGGHLSQWPADHSGWHGGSRQGADRPHPRAHRQQATIGRWFGRAARNCGFRASPSTAKPIPAATAGPSRMAAPDCAGAFSKVMTWRK